MFMNLATRLTGVFFMKTICVKRGCSSVLPFCVKPASFLSIFGCCNGNINCNLLYIAGYDITPCRLSSQVNYHTNCTCPAVNHTQQTVTAARIMQSHKNKSDTFPGDTNQLVGPAFCSCTEVTVTFTSPPPSLER
jgi:hypothetical protein